MRKAILAFLSVLLLSSVSYADNPTVYVKYLEDSDQIILQGRGFTDSDLYKIRIIDSGRDEARGWYTSRSGRDEWDIGKRGAFSHTLAKNSLVPGRTFEVRTYRRNGSNIVRTHTFSTKLPTCGVERLLVVFKAGYVWIEGTIEFPSDCGTTPPPAPPAPPADQDCQASVVVGADRKLAFTNVSCTEPAAVYVRVTNPRTGQVLCTNPTFLATDVAVNACEFRRNPVVRLDYRVEVRPLIGAGAGTAWITPARVIVKDATYLAPPTGAYTADIQAARGRLVPVPAGKFWGNGLKWQFSISARVADADVDSSELLKLIKVQLIEITGGGERVIRETLANSGETVQFDLEHQYVKPRVFGEPHDKGDLRRGENVVKVRVFDAYNGPGSVDLEPIAVSIRE